MNLKNRAFRFVILMGIVSLFGDITYEGARGVIGPYLSLLGASALIVGGLTGIAEFVGLVLRVGTGAISDKLKNPWTIIYVGYLLNLLAVPLLSLAGMWEQAAVLILLERFGKAIRTPGRDAMISKAAVGIGRGVGFGVHEALDQVGAVVGPLIVSLSIYLSGDYRVSFAILAIPAMISLFFLEISRRSFPYSYISASKSSGFSRLNIYKKFKAYLLFVFTSSAGLISFQLISYHIKTGNLMADYLLPLLYGLAMGVDAVAALGIGKAYDKYGIGVIIIIPLLTIPIIPMTLMGTTISIILAIIIWGIIIGIQETVLRAAVAEFSDPSSIGFSYGILNTTYGTGLMLGGFIMGLLYEYSIQLLSIYAIVAEIVSFVPLLIATKHRK